MEKKREYTNEEMKYLRLLSREFPSIAKVSSEIINLKAICCLPKGTEHFISDIHGEYESFLHMLKNASGVVREKVDILFADTLPRGERDMLSTLIYYPHEKIELLAEQGNLTDEWYRLTLLRLVEVCRLSASKYTRSKVRAALPADYEHVIDELLHAAHNVNKTGYNSEIINAIVETGRSNEFIVAICELIQRLVIDRLHIVGDIFDRGPGAHVILDKLADYHDVDIQWGNHDVLWMGAAAGSDVLIATTIINSLKYGNVDTIEDGYGISLSPLMSFALKIYADDPCERFMPRRLDEQHSLRDDEVCAKMHKAMAVILFKLEGEVIKRNPAFGMDERRMLGRINYEKMTIELPEGEFPLADKNLPTVESHSPYKLSEDEAELVAKLRMAFHHSQRLERHVEFLFSHGGLYLLCNGNLLFHGCMPTTAEGEFEDDGVFGKPCRGREYFERAEHEIRRGYFAKWGTPEREKALDFMWYMWCGPLSPLFGKDRMTTFERYFVEDKVTHRETKNPYFAFAEKESFARKLLAEFSLGEDSRIINGHVPVKFKKGETPIKANGRVVVIDGGMSKAYRMETGIAGYTLIDSSTAMVLACHDPFCSVAEAVASEGDIHSTGEYVAHYPTRKLVAGTDEGRVLGQRIDDLMLLLGAYKCGALREK